VTWCWTLLSDLVVGAHGPPLWFALVAGVESVQVVAHPEGAALDEDQLGEGAVDEGLYGLLLCLLALAAAGGKGEQEAEQGQVTDDSVHAMFPIPFVSPATACP